MRVYGWMCEPSARTISFETESALCVRSHDYEDKRVSKRKKKTRLLIRMLYIRASEVNYFNLRIIDRMVGFDSFVQIMYATSWQCRPNES